MNSPLFSHRDFRLYIASRFLVLVSFQMLNVAMGQYIYELTHNPLYLGYIGLALFLPRFTFNILAGHIADRFDRRLVILIARALQFLTILVLIFILYLKVSSLGLIYLLLFLMGTGNAFEGPASHALVPHLVPVEHFKNAVTWNSSVVQLSFIAGPLLAGWIYAFAGQAMLVFVVVAFLRFLSIILIYRVRHRTGRLEKSELSLQTLLAGIRYVFHKKLILGVISLDLFAVLFGGAVALMPVYANDILKVGPSGLGILRAAPALGGALMALALSRLPPFKNVGTTLLSCIALFGAATIAFGISESFIFSLICLFVLGAADMVSVVIRGVLVQLKTPPEMRGRVSAVNLVFIGASNELGEFESGVTARWFGTIPAVILGGLGTLAVVALWSWKFPEIRECKKLESPS